MPKSTPESKALLNKAGYFHPSASETDIQKCVLAKSQSLRMPEWQMQFRNVIACRSSDQVNQNNRSQHKHKHQQHVKQHIETKWQIFTPQLQSRIVDTIAFQNTASPFMP